LQCRRAAKANATGIYQCGGGTGPSGKGVGVTALMKRLLPRKIFRGLLIDASRKKGYLPKNKAAPQQHRPGNSRC